MDAALQLHTLHPPPLQRCSYNNMGAPILSRSGAPAWQIGRPERQWRAIDNDYHMCYCEFTLYFNVVAL